MTESLPPWVPHRQSEKMHWAAGYPFLLLVSLIASHAGEALSADTYGNGTENSTVTDGGFVPAAFTTVSQIIAREGSCALIDCNVTGEPIPSVQWFNSHGDRLDTESVGERGVTVTLNLVSCSLCHQWCLSLDYNLISCKSRGVSGLLFTLKKTETFREAFWGHKLLSQLLKIHIYCVKFLLFCLRNQRSSFNSRHVGAPLQENPEGIFVLQLIHCRFSRYKDRLPDSAVSPNISPSGPTTPPYSA